MPDFLAAYTAVNRFTMEEHPICNFLAAYTAVNIYQTNMQSA
ncbi:hypothetical protein [Pseudomonas aeruginosa]